jgi:serine/threonine protein phosphatase 1
MRFLAIGDIHGCLGALDELLAWVKPAPDDLVITLGDYVDRGPDTRGVLDRLIALKQDGMKLVCLRGNHEIMMLEAWKGGRDDKKQWLLVGGAQALGSYGTTPGKSGTFEHIPREHWDFINNDLLGYYETDAYIFVHAGVHRDLDMDEQPDYMLYWEFLTDEMKHKSGKTVVCGHSSQKSGVPKVVPGAVCIDTFAHGGGWLTCLDAATGRYWQTDMLGRRREGYVDYE